MNKIVGTWIGPSNESYDFDYGGNCTKRNFVEPNAEGLKCRCQQVGIVSVEIL